MLCYRDELTTELASRRLMVPLFCVRIACGWIETLHFYFALINPSHANKHYYSKVNNLFTPTSKEKTSSELLLIRVTRLLLN